MIGDIQAVQPTHDRQIIPLMCEEHILADTVQRSLQMLEMIEPSRRCWK